MIIVARGGGSVEDLLPFSDEQLVRAVAACRTPVVSAIGHEPDNPLLDLVADLRASTPTDAAKKVVPDVGRGAASGCGSCATGRCARCVGLPGPGGARAGARAGAGPSMERPAPDGRRSARRRSPRCSTRGRRTLGHLLDRADSELAHTRARVVALSPAATLERGYAVLQRAGRARGARPGRRWRAGEELRARVAEGEFTVRVGAGRSSRGAYGHRDDGRRRMTRWTDDGDGRPRPDALGYEQARDELIEVVRRLEAGGTTLEESLALWERGEELAKVCRHWLDGARARLDAALADAGAGGGRRRPERGPAGTGRGAPVPAAPRGLSAPSRPVAIV